MNLKKANNMKEKLMPLMIVLCLALSSCSSKKLIPKYQEFYKVEDKSNAESGTVLKLIAYKNTKPFVANIEEKTDFIVIAPKEIENLNLEVTKDITISPEKVDLYLDMAGKYYFPGKGLDVLDSKSFKYFDIKFGLQALTVPLKFRRSVGNDTINPPNVETGVNIGFAPGWKFTKNIFKSSKNFVGKNTTQFSIAVGPHFGLGTTDLKKTTNAPGLLSDRKVPTLTSGCFVLFGFNNINIGLALGKDYVIGKGHDNWIYQGKTWTGIIVSLDVIKY